MTTGKDQDPITRLAEESLDLAAAGQKAMMDVLTAEMRLLAALVPSAPPEAALTGDDEARRRAEDAAIEDGFDNMPV